MDECKILLERIATALEAIQEAQVFIVADLMLIKTNCMGFVMAFFWGYDEDGNKKYYDTTSSKLTLTPIYDEDNDVTTSSTLVINSLEDEMAYYGMTPEEIQVVMNKINGVSNLDSEPKELK